ncbi:hypothetical protein ASD44_06320 [Mesorhizobium sp. Root554]|uniref:hypothetical protein n=1 Tax=unclassified Mesorhizobium TaxID=325217 RepID=UPI0006FC0AA1|nr:MULTISPECIES: hypothetical protein [unclassified Mesorhizobium]KQZ13728.1 hypothetical protein ASD27_06325 [Mesorhizobium sp. Root1471]KQZ36239.1 hypothetical protein ASD44_06320 [Mesorhizobium sp. Root554]
MAISAVRLMSLIAEAVKSQPLAKADPAKVALVKALVAPAPPTGSSASTISTPIPSAALPLSEAVRSQQDGSAAVLRAYRLAGAALSTEVAADEPRPPGGASDPLARTDVSAPGARAAEPPASNRPAPFPLHGFAVLPPAAQADALAVKSGKGAVQKRSIRGVQAPAESTGEKISVGLIVTASAVVAAMLLALILAF